MIGGNDSCDSIRYATICPNCIKSFINNYIDATMDSNTAEISVNVYKLDPRFYGDYDEYNYEDRLVSEDNLKS